MRVLQSTLQKNCLRESVGPDLPFGSENSLSTQPYSFSFKISSHISPFLAIDTLPAQPCFVKVGMAHCLCAGAQSNAVRIPVCRM